MIVEGSASPHISRDRASWTLPAVLRAVAGASPDKACLRDMGGRSLSYAETIAESEKIATGLAALGVGSGDHVLLLMDNSIELVLTWIAINLLGAVEVPCNTANRGRSLEHVANNSGAAVAVIDSHSADVLVEVAGGLEHLRTVVVHGAQRPLPWGTHDLHELGGDGGELPAVEIDHRHPAAIMYTSGTTGPAKGVVVPHGHMYAFALHVVEQLRLTADDVYYVCLPLFHANAQFMQVYASFIAGGTVVVADAFSASNWIRDIHRSGATVSSLLGVMAQYIFNQAPGDLDATHAVRRMVTIPLPAAIAREFEQRFCVTCVEAYGMTETCLPLYRPLDEPLRPGSCGKPLSEWFEVRIVDPETDEPVADGEIGEIVVRPLVPFTTFAGYHRMPERTVEAWRNLWFHTGDAGWRDSDGYFYFADRLNDRIRRKGENVTAYDIEVVLTELDSVVDAAVVAKAAAEGEDDIKAYLVLAQGAGFDPVAVLEHCVSRLPYFAVPRYLEVMPDLPKTANGKVLKRELRAQNDSAAHWDREHAGWTVRRSAPHLVRLGR